MKFASVAPRLRAYTPALFLALAAFLTQFDVTAVVIAMPLIGQELKLSMAGFAWVMDAYSLAFTAALLTAGALSDRMGRRRAMISGNLLFLAASLVCAWAPDGPALWVARAAQGIGAAFTVTGAIALIAGAYIAPRDRTRAFALMGMVSGIAMALGPTLGGLIAEWFGWRWIFLANLPPCLLIAFAVPRLVAESDVTGGHALDVTGISLLTAALAMMIAALLRSHDAPMQAAFGAFASVALTGLFVRQQRRRIQPIFDIAIFAKPAMTAIAGLLLAVSVGYWAILVYLPLFLAAAFGWSSQTVGAVFMIATAPMLVIPVFGGQIAMRWGTRRLFLIALASLTVGNGLLTASSIATGHPSRLAWSILGMIGIGIGAGLAHPQLSGAVVALIPAEQAGMASAITVALRQGGFAVGIAALGAVLVHPVSIASFSGLFLLATVASITGVWAASRLR